ncbi:kinase-like protein [Ceratobasidium sp. AG-I]|nr:kinase-like protein [Ceratobasidium sp. AG-I]
MLDSLASIKPLISLQFSKWRTQYPDADLSITALLPTPPPQQQVSASRPTYDDRRRQQKEQYNHTDRARQEQAAQWLVAEPESHLRPLAQRKGSTIYNQNADATASTSQDQIQREWDQLRARAERERREKERIEREELIAEQIRAQEAAMKAAATAAYPVHPNPALTQARARPESYDDQTMALTRAPKLIPPPPRPLPAPPMPISQVNHYYAAAANLERLGDRTNVLPDQYYVSRGDYSFYPESQSNNGETLDSVQQTRQATVAVTPSEMSIPEIFNCLVEHGCVDISQHIDPTKYSSIATAGGSFGDVWQGMLLNGDKVAVKCLRFTTIVEDRPKGLKRLMRETYIWSKAKHINVQQLMGIVMFNGRLGMVSVWREYGNIQDYIRRNPGVDRHQLCVQVASGVLYLHSIGMVHGDIKALNVLVSADGVAKLNDFDHAILSNCTLAFSATTNVGGGTLRWMAPELLLMTDEDANVGVLRTTRTDVYALGMIMLEIFTGKVPYAEYGRDGPIYSALTNKQPPARPIILMSPTTQADEMWNLLRSCWNHNPTLRPNALSVLTSLLSLDVKPPSST